MSQVKKLSTRFAELVTQLDAVEATKAYRGGGAFDGDYVESHAFLGWEVKAKSLIGLACGEGSEHYREFVERAKGSWGTNYHTLLNLKAVFLAAKEDYDGGYLSSVRNLVQAELFSDEIEQARELLKGGYSSAAAVVAGVVLETTLRQMCTDQGLSVGKLDKMNADLAKAEQYSLLVQKRITALADVRNNAAHGHPEAFSKADVEDMITYVERFLEERLG